MIANGLIPVLRELKEHTNLGEPDLTRISLEGQLQAVARIIQTLYNPYEGFMVLDDLLPEPERLTWRDFFSRQTDHSGWGE
jgi:hypothetical protein